jgi:CO/xanthine dehydrogenase FAD-binding subunit
VPIRATAAEEWLVGQIASSDAWNTAAGLAQEATMPTGDIHADAKYRRDVAGSLTYETLRNAYERALRD